MDATELSAKMDDASKAYWALVNKKPWLWGPNKIPDVDDSELQALKAVYDKLANEYERITGEHLWIRNCRATNSGYGISIKAHPSDAARTAPEKL